MKREINAALTELKDEKDTGTVLPVQNKISGMPEEKLNRIRMAILALAIIFIIAGMANGNMQAVMVKAINICTECVGLG
jgi:hypothetical protein